MIEDLLKALKGELSSWSPASWFPADRQLRLFWHPLKMKLTVGSVAVALALGTSAQAGCPDYTTFAQVSTPRKLFLYSITQA